MGFIKELLAYINPLSAYWKEAVLAAIATFCFYAGYHLHTLQDASSELAKQQAAIAEYKKGEDYRGAISAAYESGRSKGMSDTKLIHQNLKVSREKTHAIDCPISSDELQAINQ